MRNSIQKLSVLLVFALVLQLFFPVASTFAAAPSAPANLKLTKLAPNEIRLEWSAVSGATGYKVYELVNGSPTFVGNAGNIMRTLQNLTQGTHTYAVTALNGTEESPLSASVSTTIVFPTMLPPTTPTYVIQNGNDISLRWTSTSEYTQSYNVYEIVDGQRKLLANTTSTGRLLSNQPEGSRIFAVTSVHSAYGESEFSGQIEVNLVHPKMVAPTGLNRVILNGNDVSLRWTEAAYASSYNIYEWVDGQRKLLVNTTGISRLFQKQSEGLHRYEVTSVSDRFGESADSAALDVTVTYPIIAAPGNFTATIFNGNDITLKWSTVDYATKYSIYRVQDGTRTLIGETEGTVRGLINQPEGTHQFEVEAFSDRFGKSEPAKVSITVKYPVMQPPGVTRTLFQNGNDLRLTWDESLYATKYKVYQILEGQRKLIKETQTTYYGLDNAPQGTYQYEITSYSDRFGESPTVKEVTVNVVHPVMQPPTQFTYSLANGNDVTLKWDSVQYANRYNVYQMVDGVKKFIFFSQNNQNTLQRLPKGDYTYIIHSYSDRFGESPNGKSVTVPVDVPEMIAPHVDLTMTGVNQAKISWSPTLYAETYNVYRLVNGEPQLIKNVSTTYHTVTGLDKMQAYEFFVTAVHSRFGESKRSNIVSPEFDTVAPITFPGMTSDWSKTSVEVAFTAKDTQSGVDKTYVSLNGGAYQVFAPFTISTEGITQVSFYSVDKAGNQEQPKTVEVKIDKVAPVSTSDYDANNPNQTEINFTATDDRSGVKSILFAINGGTPQAGTKVEVTPLVNTIKFYAVDMAGNIEAEKAINLNRDVTAPITTGNEPQVWVTSDYTVELTATDDMSGVAHTYYSLDEGKTYAEGNQFTVTEEGIHKILFYSVDKAGNKERAHSMEVKLDKVAPTTKTNAPEGWVNGKFVLALSPKDQWSGVSQTFYSVDGGEFKEGAGVEFKEEGDHIVTFYSVDYAGNKEAVQSVTIKVDLIAPKTEIAKAPSATGAGMVLTLSATDKDSGVQATRYSISGDQFTDGNTISITEPGLYQIKYYSVDMAGNIESMNTEEVIYDPFAPVTVSNIEDRWYSTDALVALKATDDISGVDKTFYSLNGSEFAEGTAFQIEEEGTHKVSFYSTDKVGNQEAVQTAEMKVDRTAPVTTSTPVEGEAGQYFKVLLSPTDNLSGVAKTYYAVDGSEFIEGTTLALTEPGEHTIGFYSVDNAGNEEKLKTITVMVDVTAPVTESNLKGNWVNSDFIARFTATDDLSGVDKTFFSIGGGEFQEGDKHIITEEGTHVFTFYSVDKAGNVEEKKTGEVKLDKTAPVTEVDAQSGYAKLGTPIRFTATDNLSGVEQTIITVNNQLVEGSEVTLNEEGTYLITYYSKDIAGNLEEAKKLQLIVDNTPPQTVSNVQDIWYNTDVDVKLTATDNLSGVDKTFYAVNGGEFAEGTSALLTEEGTHSVSFYSVDKAGNIEEVQTVAVKIDKTAPVTASNLEGVKYSKPGFEINLNPTDNLSGVAKTFYSLDGGAFQEGTTFTLESAKAVKIAYYSVDNAGNIEETHVFELIADDVAPVTTSDIQDIWTNQDVPVTLTATDDLSGVKTTYYSVDGAAEQEGTSFTVTGEGIHTVTFYSVDNAGNIEQANTAEVKIDKTAPTVTLAPLKSEYVMGDKLTLSYTATDNLSGIASSVMTVNGKEVANGTTLTLQPGEYTVQVTATDNAGNKTTTTVQQKFVVAILAEMEVTPMVINPNPGIFTVRLTMPKGYKYNFDIPTVSVNGAKVRGNGNPEGQAASGMFKFERMDVEKWIMPETTLVFRGYTKDGYLVIAKKTVKVNDADGGKGNTKGNGKGK